MREKNTDIHADIHTDGTTERLHHMVKPGS